MTAPDLLPGEISSEEIVCTIAVADLRRRLTDPDVQIAAVIEEHTGDPNHPLRMMLTGLLHELDQAEANPSLSMHTILTMTIDDMQARIARARGGN